VKKKVLLSILSVFVIVLIAGVIYYFKYLYKYNQIARFTNDRNQDVYILGTYHNMHMKKIFNYSMEDITSCIKNVNPDVILIESREKTYDDYNVVDGPIDMILAYSYGVQEKIDIEMIDYWEIDDDNEPGTTNKNRDDIINNNIIKKLDSIGEGKRVLIICGDTHFHEQIKRFKGNGFNKVKIENKKKLFSVDYDFKYPVLMEKVIEDKIEYSSTILKNDLNNLKNSDNREKWEKAIDSLVKNLKKQLELVKENKLYN